MEIKIVGSVGENAKNRDFEGRAIKIGYEFTAVIGRILLILTSIFFANSCGAQGQSSFSSDPAAVNLQRFDEALGSFSTAVSTKNVPLFLELTDPKGIHLVRKFTSGNLGGRGEPLSKFIPLSKINAELAVDVKNQTAFDIPGLFMNFPLISFSAVPQRDLLPDTNSTAFDQWESVLKASLEGAPEVVDGDPVILRSSKYYVYAEAQIITDILVGGFAVFELQNGKAKLVALIELL